jgi:hypothetical protein
MNTFEFIFLNLLFSRVRASLQRATTLAPIARERNYHLPCAIMRIFMGTSPTPQQALQAVSGMFWDLPELSENWLFLVYEAQLD